MYQRRADLDFMKRKVLAGEEPWKGAWDRLLKASYSSMDFDPKPIAHVIRGAYGRPSVGGNELMASGHAAYSQAHEIIRNCCDHLCAVARVHELEALQAQDAI